MDYHPAWRSDQTGDGEVVSCLTDHTIEPQVDRGPGLKKGGGEIIGGMPHWQHNLVTELLTMHT